MKIFQSEFLGATSIELSKKPYKHAEGSGEK